MDASMHFYAILHIIHVIISVYYWILIGSAVMSWLFAFRIVNVHNQIVSQVAELLYRLTEPVLRPIRRVLPNLGGIDISPVIALLLLYFIDLLIYEYLG
jgi:YggT family protein